ncbi:terpenoid cyclases/protein prenyltransferase alpha-alpha toroid [Pavlovales sp. CCMP2436]|nr:terpenoid cyclases/protein prenyltransferase alpha-alpha toroid [Pavlovales sp. CCMP2436]
MAHLASTYTALATLLALGDNLVRVERNAVLLGVRSTQHADGAFSAYAGGEADMRFVFCAAAVGTLLGDREWSCLDHASTVAYIVSSVSYEGGIGLGPGQEAHGGSTFCGIAALSLLGALDALPSRAQTTRWCLQRQVTTGGFQGRANKDADTCYSYWIGASLALLEAADLVSARESSSFTCRCQYRLGGLCKQEGAPPDPLHSCLSLCGLALLGRFGLEPMEPALGITARAWALARSQCEHLR